MKIVRNTIFAIAFILISDFLLAGENANFGKNWRAITNLPNGSGINVGIQTKKNVYHINETIILSILSDEDGFFWVTEVDQIDDELTLVYPQKQSQDNKIEKNKLLRLPPPNEGDWDVRGPEGFNLISVFVVSSESNRTILEDAFHTQKAEAIAGASLVTKKWGLTRKVIQIKR